MTSFSIRETEKACKELTDAGLAGVVDCPVCHGFTRQNLIQLHKLAHTAQTCPGCYFLQGILVVLDKSGFEVPIGRWTRLLLTSWNLWGAEHFLTIARCERRPLEQWQVPTILDEADFIEVFKTPGETCPWAKVPTAKLVSGDTGSPACLQLLQARLNECMRKHSRCIGTADTSLPARLLEISLTENDQLAVKLVETDRDVGKYVCLSHRWIEGHTITTTTSNIDQRRANIPWNELPKTFREAITVTFVLGFKYIWIDSLAINQDQASGDWLVEAPKMAQYYSNSSLTIFAAEAMDGLFYELPEPSQVMWKVKPPDHFNQPSYNICIRKPLSHDTSALHRRGWVFQEHLLSPRIAHFGKELIWECAEVTACECGRFPLRSKGGRSPLHDPWDIGNVASSFGRKAGHVMALSSERSSPSYYLQPEPVFIEPDPMSGEPGLRISHWLLTQKQLGGESVEEDTSVKVEKKDLVATNDPLLQSIDDLSHRFVFLQTGGVRKKDENGPDAASSISRTSTDATTEKTHTLQNDGVESPPPRVENREEEHQSEADQHEVEDYKRIWIYPPTPLGHSHWLDIVAQYTRRSLTFKTDVFPALAGLAKQLQENAVCEYYAGLWETTFAVDLLWRTRNPGKHPKLKDWRAPSWSWASVTAAVDYYHLMMAFELDTHTFRYSISQSYIQDVQVECVPAEGDDITMRLMSARVTLTGAIFELVLGPPQKRQREKSTEALVKAAKGGDDMRSVMEQAICLPDLSVPEDDIRYFPLARCMDKPQMTSWLARDTGLDFAWKNNQEREVRQSLDIWWDYKEGAETDMTFKEGSDERVYECLLVARHESTVDTAYFGLLLKRTEEYRVYERVGLVRIEEMMESVNLSTVTIV